MKNKNIEFRTAVGGFNKQDVIRYIEEMTRDVSVSESDHKHEIEQAQNEYKALNDKYNKLSEFSSATAAENEQLKNEIKEKDEIIEELDSAAVRISVELDSLSSEFSSLISKFEELQKQLSENEELRRKAEAYDKIAQKIKEHKKTVSEPQKEPIISTESADEILERLNDVKEKFNKAIADAQNETSVLKSKIAAVLSNSNK